MTDEEKPKKPMPDLKLKEGETPQQRGSQKIMDVLTWLYRFGVSTADIINLVSGQLKPGFAKRLADKGLIVATLTESGQPKYFYTLSQEGHDIAASYAPIPIRYRYFEPYKIKQSKFSHDFCAQRLSLEASKRNGFEVHSQAQIAVRHKAGAKIPDAVWVDKDKQRIAVEVEFTQKSKRDLDQTITAIIRSLEADEYSCYFYFVRADVIATNYTRAMSPGATIDHWEKNPRGAWTFFKENREAVPASLIDRIFFMAADKPFEDPRPLGYGL